jgi:hypothetical protein
MTAYLPRSAQLTHIHSASTSRPVELMPPEGPATLRDLAETLLQAPCALTPGERELITSVVSRTTEPVDTCVSARLRALVRIADKARSDAKALTTEDIDAAQEAGATASEIRDAVLIATAIWLIT